MCETKLKIMEEKNKIDVHIIPHGEDHDDQYCLRVMLIAAASISRHLKIPIYEAVWMFKTALKNTKKHLTCTEKQPFWVEGDISQMLQKRKKPEQILS